MKNIILIGMPGTGKSVVGRALAERLHIRLTKRGMRGLYGEGIFRGPEEDACTTDGSHPNDLGFMKMADSIGRILRRAMRRNI